MREGEDERVLVDRFVSGGDRRAFEELVRFHLPSIRRFLATRLRDREEMEEAEQDLLVRMFESLPRWKGDSSLRTWLYRLCAISAADLVRRRSREREKSRRLVLAGSEAESRESDRADWIPLRSAEAELVRACLAELGEPGASLVYLRDAEGFGVEELSVIFGMPEGTVKSRLSRGRDKLKLLLSKAGFGEA
ncbi:MAG: RNA polymerase sigma factor [Treponema sp.]|nr:RNA polymerase sigma factor [Treponema sp.]